MPPLLIYPGNTLDRRVVQFTQAYAKLHGYGHSKWLLQLVDDGVVVENRL
jgi:hypothetical protein